MVDAVREHPVDVAQRRWRRKALLLLLGLVLCLVLFRIIRRFTTDRPVTYRSEVQHFLYGSIGSEPGGSLLSPVGGMLPPYQVFAVLPRMFPDRLPGGYASLGLIFETNAGGSQLALPIGVSQRHRLGFDWVGLNCAVCHVGTYRTAPDAERVIVPGMPAHQLDLQGLFRFVMDSILDPRFTGDNTVGAIESTFGRLSVGDRLLVRNAIVPQMRERILLLHSRVGALFTPEALQWGPGRVDTFNPYKAIQFNWALNQLPPGELIGASDFPALWNQAPRDGLNLHWDGNNSSLAERNLSAGLGAGITPVTVDHAAIDRVDGYIRQLPPPPWPKGKMPLDESAAHRGQEQYTRYCAECHDFGAAHLGQVVELSKIGTDRARFDSYTLAFADNQNTLFPDSTNRFHTFHKTIGYVNQPLDGIWARAPYLHNGSVPTLADLLEPPARRPARFYRGYDVYDAERGGFVSQVAEERGRKFFLYRTVDDSGRPVLGNSKEGHLYGTDLTASAKRDLVEYLKTK